MGEERAQDNFMKLFYSFHLCEGSRNLTQVTKLICQTDLLAVSSCPIPTVLMLDYIIDSPQCFVF